MQDYKDAREIETASGGSDCTVLLDVGGTTVKSALAISIDKGKGISICFFHREIIDSHGSASTIFATIARIVERDFKEAGRNNFNVRSLGISVPGPFDCTQGISLMRHKYSSIYGINLKKSLSLRLNLKRNFPFRFEYDSSAFLLGESQYGAARNYNRVVGITLGTGIGSSFLVSKRIRLKGKGIPPEGIYAMECEGGSVEEKIYRKAIIGHYNRLSRSETAAVDMEEIALSAKSGDVNAVIVFEEFGEKFGKILKPIAEGFKADCIVLGGAVTNSYGLFKLPLENQLNGISRLRKVCVAQLGDLSALYGLTTHII